MFKDNDWLYGWQDPWLINHGFSRYGWKWSKQARIEARSLAFPFNMSPNQIIKKEKKKGNMWVLETSRPIFVYPYPKFQATTCDKFPQPSPTDRHKRTSLFY